MFKNLKAKTEQMNDLITRAESIVSKAELEKRELTEDEAQELAEIRDDVKAIKDFLGVANDLEAAAEEVGEAKAGETRSTEANEAEAEIAKREYNAFDNYLRNKIINERDGELKPSNNGAIIPKTIAKNIIELVYDICPILEKSDKYNVAGKLEVPKYPASAATQITVAYATEFSALTSTTGNFTTVELGGFLMGALTKVSESLINNVDFDVVGFVVRRMAYDIARFLEKQLLGNGDTTKIKGLSELAAGQKVTAGSTSVITADELITVQGKVKDVFQADALWVMSPATRDAVRLLKDDVGRYLLQDDISAPFGKTLLGKPVYVSDNMDDIAASKVVIYYGDMSGLSTKFAEEINVKILREKFADEHAVGVIGWCEADARVTNDQKISALVMAAS